MKSLLRALLCASILLRVPFAFAAPPATINYQGTLANTGGTPVNGAVVMTFRLYNAASGGSALYSETQLSVGVTNGNFNTVIGSVSPITLPFDVPYWLTVAINADPEMSPRQPLNSSPYAFRASRLDSTATIVGTQVTGNVAGADFANSAGSANVATTSMMALGLMGFLPGAQISGAITSATMPAAQITGTLGSAQLAATQRLPTVACAVNEIAQWNGLAWICATASSGNNGTITGNLTMLNSTATEGNIIKDGALFMHNTGFESAYLGSNAGNLTTTGGSNTGVGVSALGLVQGGFANSAFGNGSLYRNTVGTYNTGIGVAALVQNVNGSSNTAIGANALQSATANDNIAIGSSAGANITVGGKNILIGNPGDPMDANTLRLGSAANQTRTFIAGIRGVTPALGTLPVVIDSNGQLGTGAAAVGGVTSVATGVGLTGGPIATTGTISLASTQLLPVGACATNQVAKWNGSAWACASDNDTNSGGTVTSITAGNGLTGGTITGAGTLEIDPSAAVLTGNFVRLGGNSVSGTMEFGNSNGAVRLLTNGDFRVYNTNALYSPSVTLGHPGNFAALALGATVSGGGSPGAPNIANGTASFIGGGRDNNIDAIGANGVIAGGQGNRINGLAGNGATIGGGLGNKAQHDISTVAGGNDNTASGLRSTVGGGTINLASGSTATISGGHGNIGSGDFATVPGGFFNSASGNYSFAAGRQAKANSFGCFTWADSNATDFACNTGNAFMARATGGVQFRTSLNLSTGCDIAVGGGAWSCTSSRETKKDFTAMNPLDVLKRVIDLPVTQWRYQAEVSGARHVGPMAEDFHAAFGLGDSNKTINVIDASGVALVAIQGLNELVSKKDAEIETQGRRIKLLEDALAAIQARLGMR